MTERKRIPETVGELVELLQHYPKDAQLSVYITEIYDNGSVYSGTSTQMAIESYDDSDDVILTFGNGSTLPGDD